MSKRTLFTTAAGGAAFVAVVATSLYLTGVIGCIPKTKISLRREYLGGQSFKAVEDWPKWRGPRGDQISRETIMPAQWPGGGPPVLWSADVGLGHSSPIAMNGIVYLFSMDDKKETLTAFAAGSGRILWSVEGSAGWTSSYVGTRATPTIDGDRIYTYGGNGELVCRKLKDGAQIWRINILSETGSSNLGWGVASSPLVDESRVYVQSGKGGAVAIAADKNTGKIVWKSQAQGLGGYAAPIFADVGGTRQLVLFAGEVIYGVNFETGQTIWQHPWRTMYDVNASTPIFDPATSRLFCTSGYGHGAIQLQLAPAGATVVWENNSIEGKYQGAILDSGFLYGNSEGTIVCVDWKTGVLAWKERDSKHRLGAGGTLVRVDDKLIGLSERGKLLVFQATPKGATKIAEAKVLEGSEIWATPLLYGGRLYIKGMQELVCLDVGGK